MTTCLLWQKVAGVIRGSFVTAFEGEKVEAEKSWEISGYTSLVTVGEHTSTQTPGTTDGPVDQNRDLRIAIILIFFLLHLFTDVTMIIKCTSLLSKY